MALHKLTVELSDDEISVLKELSRQDGTTPNEALKKAIAQAGYLLEKSNSGQQIFIGNVKGDKLTGSQINIGGATFGNL